MDVDEAFKLAFISAARFSTIPLLMQSAAKGGVQLEKPMTRPAAQKR
jgi:hypothetical protein